MESRSDRLKPGVEEGVWGMQIFLSMILIVTQLYIFMYLKPTQIYT